MAFWGIEVKPGEPITHFCEKARGRLRIQLATLGISGAAKKTTVQCNVGNGNPILLCSLLPSKIETLHVGLEFEESDDVVFSVIGPRSVFLSGYYVLQSQQSNVQSDAKESFGVDIENSHAEASTYNSDDKHEDSFIDNDGVKVSPSSPGKGLDEPTVEFDKPKGRKGRGKQLKKKSPVIESNKDAKSHESQDEDEAANTLSSLKSKGAAKTTISDAKEIIAEIIVEMGDEAKDNGVCGTESKQKVDPLDINDNLERETNLPLDKEGVEIKNDIPEEVETLEENIVSNEKVLTGDMTIEDKVTDTIINQNPLTSNGEDQKQPPDLCGICAKPKKKRKRPSVRQDKTCEVQTGNEDKEHEVEASTDVEIGANSLATPPELDSVDAKKSRKKRNVLRSEGTYTEGLDEKRHDITEEDKDDQGLVQNGDSVVKDVPVANGESEEQQRLEETSAEGIGGKSPDITKEDKLDQDILQADNVMKDQTVANGEYQEQLIDNNAATNKSEKKTKKKRKKAHSQKDSNTNVTDMADNEETTHVKNDEQTLNAASIQKRTLSNGLIIEELASGPPNGKVAAPGKKIKFHYTGMLKESGLVFDSNVGKTAFKFRLGDEEFIDGWNVGIEGMRVGDKRRLIIPPSMGFGDHAIGENIPPNSWLVYDVELVSVRK
ncbi:hypothetical protein ABFS82_02G151200 [Erythranthe guttata]|nr:PREDICTED: peptidyl-prolyl cis-trans isomerase FKBP43-like [Erythranthe guttata]|eukprot:XP_012843604.1 PREDICTED: peptidyl-prolyl cis-trans isomerase FKBP43-like [Erythranthe guttata]